MDPERACHRQERPICQICLDWPNLPGLARSAWIGQICLSWPDQNWSFTRHEPQNALAIDRKDPFAKSAWIGQTCLDWPDLPKLARSELEFHTPWTPERACHRQERPICQICLDWPDLPKLARQELGFHAPWTPERACHRHGLAKSAWIDQICLDWPHPTNTEST